MNRSERELDLDESAVGRLLLGAVVGLAAVLGLGVWIGQLAVPSRADLVPTDEAGSRTVSIEPTAAGHVAEPVAPGPLPRGFIGPPAPPYPPPVGGVAGFGPGAEGASWAVQFPSSANPADAGQTRLRLLGRGFPAYLVPEMAGVLRIGDYSTRGEADLVVAALLGYEQVEVTVVELVPGSR